MVLCLALGGQLHVGLLCKEFPSGLIDVCACAGPVIQQDDKSLNDLHESNLPATAGRSHMGPVTASNSCAAFANQLGLDEDRGQSV